MKRFRRLVVPAFAVLAVASGSHAVTPAGARVDAAPPTASVSFEVFLPLRDKASLAALLVAQQTRGSASYHRWLSPAQFKARFGPTAASFAAVEAAATTAGLQVAATHTRSLRLTGAVSQVGRFLGTGLNIVTFADGHSRFQAVQPTATPATLEKMGAVVVAFTGIPEKRVHVMRVGSGLPDNAQGAYGPYFYNDMKQTYDYPSYVTKIAGGKRLNGTGVAVAVVMAGGVQTSDVAAYFQDAGFNKATGQPAPTFETLNINGGSPYSANSDGTVEASLDVQQVLGGAPQAQVTLVNLPDLSDDSIMEGYRTIVDDNTWDLVNSSFGECELFYTAAYNGGIDFTSILQTYDEIFQQGNSEGITFVASSGDSGGKECTNVNYLNDQRGAKFIAGVSSPTDDPNVTAVGGGNLETTPPPSPQTTPPTVASKYVAENAFGNPETPYDPFGIGENASGGIWGAGGGLSTIWAQPSWQTWVQPLGGPSAGRIVPDVGMQVGGCPGGISQTPCPSRSGYGVSFVVTVVGGEELGLIGTSVASPEFVGALALAVEAGSARLGNVNPFLWNQGQSQVEMGGAKAPLTARFFRKGQPGSDGIFTHSSTTGFDYMYGNGSPDVRRLFGMMAFAAANNPGTPSNP